MDPIMFKIFGLEIRWYSVLIMIGMLICYFLVKRESKKFDYSKDFIFDLAFWVIICGVIGARLYYVLFNLDYYGKDLTRIFAMWEGGLAIHGGVIGGFIGLLVMCIKNKVSIFRTTDMIAPGLLIAQAIGRWGNFFNGEAFGGVVEYKTLVNMKIIPQFVIDNMYINEAYHLPMFYFESLFCILGFIIMLLIRRRKYIKNGQIFGFYLIWYGVLRFFIEIFRTDALMIANIKVAQLVSVVMVLIGIYINAAQIRKPKLDDLYNSVEQEIIF